MSHYYLFDKVWPLLTILYFTGCFPLKRNEQNEIIFYTCMSKKLRFLFYLVTALLIGSAVSICYWIFLNVNNLTNIGLFKSFGENRQITGDSNEVGRFCYDAYCYCNVLFRPRPIFLMRDHFLRAYHQHSKSSFTKKCHYCCV